MDGRSWRRARVTQSFAQVRLSKGPHEFADFLQTRKGPLVAGPDENGLKIGRGDRIRTCDLYVPNVALYQTELHPDSRAANSSGAPEVEASLGCCGCRWGRGVAPSR